MTDLRQPRIIKYGSAGKLSQYGLTTPPPAAHVSLKPEQVGTRYGWVEIMSPEKRWSPKWNRCYVLTRCTGCGAIQWQELGNLRGGRSKGCQMCSRHRTYPKWLDRRFTAAKQRCTNPNDRGYRNYGARGIQFRFSSVKEACLYMIQTNGLPGRELEIDRIDVNGHYEPGNLRWVTHQVNCMNQRKGLPRRRKCTTSSTPAPDTDSP